MSVLLYLVGMIVFISGLAWIATVVGISNAIVTSVAAILLAVGLLTMLARGRVRDHA